MEEVHNGDPQTVAQLLDGGDGGAVIPPADDVVNGRLCYPALGTKTIDRNIVFLTELQNPVSNRFSDCDTLHLLSILVM